MATQKKAKKTAARKASRKAARRKRAPRVKDRVRARIKRLWKKEKLTIREIAEREGIAPSSAWRISRSA